MYNQDSLTMVIIHSVMIFLIWFCDNLPVNILLSMDTENWDSCWKKKKKVNEKESQNSIMKAAVFY